MFDGQKVGCCIMTDAIVLYRIPKEELSSGSSIGPRLFNNSAALF